mgnify:FL=1|jgi:hypothetical protein|tara:strand:+ start:361 stop:771 length:411 start_codon:yes stop_codon:yes gene_type:complete
MGDDIEIFVTDTGQDFVAEITVDDNTIADTNITGTNLGDLIVSFLDTAAGVGSLSKLTDLLDVNSSNLSSGGAGDKFVLTFDASTNKFVFVNPDAVIDAAVGVNTTDPSPTGISSAAIDYLDDVLDDKIDLDAGSF